MTDRTREHQTERTLLHWHIGLAWGVALLIVVLTATMPCGRCRAVARVVEPTVRASIVPGHDRLIFAGDIICDDDCSGHLAGWRWAQRNNVESPDQCSGTRSNSFLEGCETYLWAIGEGRKPDL